MRRSKLSGSGIVKMRTNTPWRMLLNFCIIVLLFFLSNFVPMDSARWSFVAIAMVLAPWFLIPIAAKYWFGSEMRIAPDRWIALALAVVLLLAAAFLPSAFFERLMSFSRGRSSSEVHPLAFPALLLLVFVILLAAYSITRTFQRRKR